MQSNQQTFGERLYSFGTIPAMEAIRVEVSIARVIGEPLFKAFVDTKKKDGLTEDEVKQQAKEAGAAAIGLIASKMDADELLKTMSIVFKYVTCDGKRITDDLNHFTGHNKELWEVFIAALRYNFADFLPESLFNSGLAMVKG